MHIANEIFIGYLTFINKSKTYNFIRNEGLNEQTGIITRKICKYKNRKHYHSWMIRYMN